MENTREMNRKEFLKLLPQYVAQNMHLLIQGRFSPPYGGEAEVLEDDSSNNKAAKVAQLKTECCLAWEGGSCQFCYLACPLRDKAIILDDQKPMVNILFCDGCAKCGTACQTVNDRSAIKMVVSKIS